MTETLTFETLTEKLDAAGIEYTHLDRGSDREVLDIPGYGKIWYDNREQLGEEFGWVVESDGYDDPTVPEELLADLDELADMVARIK